MKPALINYSDKHGGAARAAYRIHRSILSCGVDSTMYVTSAASDDPTVVGPKSGLSKAFNLARPLIVSKLSKKVFHTSNRALHSPAFFSSGWPRNLNSTNHDIVHLHWINNEMLSIGDVAQIKKPVLWTLHDMWAFCGAEHHTQDFRWRDGYHSMNRPSYESGFDLNKWVSKKKSRAWRPMNIIAPSLWLADCVQQSKLMRGWPVSVIPNPLDTEIWKPIEKQCARRLLGLPSDVPILLFGAIGGVSDPIKGFDLLRESLRVLRERIPEVLLVVFGQGAPKNSDNLYFPIRYTGHIHDDISLRILYSAADVMVVPSKIESFCQTASEAQACGTPVVAFNATGVKDVVSHMKSGYLAAPYLPDEFAYGIEWVLNDSSRYIGLCDAARKRAVQLWSYQVVAPQYLRAYESAISTFSECG